MIREKYNVYGKAFKELNEIFKYFPKREYEKIPESFIKFVEDNIDNSYEYKVEHIDDFQNQEIMKETKVLLSIVYRDFIASPNVKNQMLKMESAELLKEEKRIQEKYNSNNLLKNRKNILSSYEENIQEESSIVEYKEKNFLQKVLDKIINLFKA